MNTFDPTADKVLFCKYTSVTSSKGKPSRIRVAVHQYAGGQPKLNIGRESVRQENDRRPWMVDSRRGGKDHSAN